jgi:TatD DNase family protein
LLVETDAPYLAPQPQRGKRNEPAFVRHTAECLAEVHGLTLNQMAEITTANARRLLGLAAESPPSAARGS